MLELSQTDELIYERFIEEGIFEELNPEDIPRADGTIGVLCSDCDRFPDAIRDLWNASGTERVHPAALNGGALHVAEDPFENPIPMYVRIDNGAPVNGIEEIRFRLIFPNGEHLVVRTKTERIINPMTGTVLLWNIKEAERMKGIETLLLKAHAPCGVAYHFGWDLAVVTAKVLAAENVVRERIAGEHDLHIIPVCRVLRGEHEVLRRVNRERFVAWNTRR